MAGRGGEDDGQVGFDRVALVVSLVGQEPDGALRVQAARLGEPGLAEAVRGVGLEISRASHDDDEGTGGQRRLRYALSDQRLAASQARAFGPLCRGRQR
jgi:hypothetical protein